MALPYRTLASAFLAGLVVAGPFCAAEAGSLAATHATLPQGSAVDLSAAGPADWVHWGHVDPYNPARKASVPAQISDYTLITSPMAYVQAYAYGDNFNGYSWTDGAPLPGMTNSTTGLYLYGTPPTEGTGFEISAPAGTQTRILRVYVGVYSGQGQIVASLSDQSAPAYTDSSLSYNANGASRVYQFTYAANSAGQLLRVKWLLAKKQGGAMQVPNVTLQAAALATPGIDVPPAIVLTAPSNTAQFAVGQPITLEAAAVDIDNAVTNVEFFCQGEKIGAATAPPYSLVWASAVTGWQRLTAVASDEAGQQTVSGARDIFVHGPGGFLAGSFAASPTFLDLTAEGGIDWIHWGLAASNSIDRKAVVTPWISNFAVTGTNVPRRVTDSVTLWQWTDGTPTVVNSFSSTGLILTGRTNGFDLVVPASPSPKLLRLYTGVYGARASLRAHLSDASAPAFADESLSGVYETVDRVYTIQFASGSPAQELRLSFRGQGLFDQEYGGVRLMTATLGEGTVALPAVLLNPHVSGGEFVFSLYTTSNRLYTIEQSQTLSEPWIPAGVFWGSGKADTVTNLMLPGANFYRVHGE